MADDFAERVRAIAASIAAQEAIDPVTEDHAEMAAFIEGMKDALIPKLEALADEYERERAKWVERDIRWMAPGDGCMQTEGCNGLYYPSKLKCNQCGAPEVGMPKPAGAIVYVPYTANALEGMDVGQQAEVEEAPQSGQPREPAPASPAAPCKHCGTFGPPDFHDTVLYNNNAAHLTLGRTWDCPGYEHEETP